MSTLLVYFSMSGITRRVAKDIATVADAELCEIMCHRYRPGMMGYLRLALDLFLRRSPKIELRPPVEGPYALVVLGGPVWWGMPAPPLRGFLRHCLSADQPVALFLTCDGGNPKSGPETALAEMKSLVKGPVRATRIFRAAEINDPEALALEVGAFASAVRAGTG